MKLAGLGATGDVRRRVGAVACVTAGTLMVLGSVIGNALVEAAPTTGGTISGTIYRDYNDNGVRDTGGTEAIDGPLASVGVTATCVSDAGADATVGTADDSYGPAVAATSSPTGAYTLVVAGSPCRVEASPSANSEPSAIGAGNGSTVRFVPATSTAVDFGFFTPGEYCQSNPKLVTNCFVGGNGAAYGYTGIETEPAAIGATHGNDGNPFNSPNVINATPTLVTPTSVTGAVYGHAWDPATRRLFSGSYLKRKVPLIQVGGVDHAGRVYVTTDPNSAGASTTLLVDLDAVFGAGTAGVTGRIADPPLTYWDDDVTVNALIGKVGLGDLETSADGSKLYAVNLADRQLYVIPTSGPLTSVTIKRYPIPTNLTCAAADVRPFGLGLDPRTGALYVGAVCSGETGGAAALRSFVFTFDGAAYTKVLDEALTRPTSYASWTGWVTSTNGQSTPQPMLSDISFHGGNLSLAYRDRFGDQMPSAGLRPWDSPYPIGYGDTVLACPSGAAFVISGCGAQSASTEFYQDFAGDNTDESGSGSLAQIPGWSGVFSTAHNAVSTRANGGRLDSGGFLDLSRQPNLYTGGVQYFDNTSGAMTGNQDFYKTDVTAEFTSGLRTGYFGKTNGMGDLEALCDLAPVEIGNRLWFDRNANGVQDAGEQPVIGATVALYADSDGNGVPDGAAIRTVSTDGNGGYVFSGDSSRTSTASAAYAIAQLTPAAKVIVGFPVSVTSSSVNYHLTAKGVGTASTDSDAIVATGYTDPITLGTAGQNRHVYDAGYSSTTAPPPTTTSTTSSTTTTSTTTTTTTTTTVPVTTTTIAPTTTTTVPVTTIAPTTTTIAPTTTTTVPVTTAPTTTIAPTTTTTVPVTTTTGAVAPTTTAPTAVSPASTSRVPVVTITPVRVLDRTQSRPLAVTGTNARLLLFGGVALIAVGFALTARGRRRRR